ncbi:MAG: 50S ribosomal protein L6 [Patescibacteria group bacterium]
MSRTGKLPIEYSSDTQINVEKGMVTVKGPKGELQQQLHSLVYIDIGDNQVHVKVKDPEDRRQRALWGLHRSLVNNMVQGVEKGFQKQLEVNGVGYKIAMKGDDTVILNVGFSHPAEYKLPEGVSASVEGNVITISGIDKQLVGKAAAQIKNIKKAEPYKGKGLKYVGEEIKRKEGKTSSK